MDVTRKVDTVIISMDISMAEKLKQILALVDDRTTMARYYPRTNDLASLVGLMDEEEEINHVGGGTFSEPKVRDARATKVYAKDGEIIIINDRSF